jgi:hypothetical protein
MTAVQSLDILRSFTAQCAGVALFTGAPLVLAGCSGEPTLAGWASWAEVADAVTALLQEAPVAASEALLRLPGAVVLVEARPAGAVVVVMALAAGAGAGMALVQARVAASKLMAPEMGEAPSPGQGGGRRGPDEGAP